MFLRTDVETSNEQNELIIKTVKEWAKGCTCTEDRPSDCEDCTKSMIRYLEEVIHGIT